MKILLIGQCTLHWGRMEFGNIGNFYIIEPFVRQLHQVFKNCKIKTTFQMSERFCESENIEVLPMELYYSWSKNDLEIALQELASASLFSKTDFLPLKSPYIKEVLNADLIIDFSGDIWGDNADFLGKNRFLVGLIKNRVAQLLNKKTVMIAGSPGPFNNQEILPFAKEVYKNFDLVTNRESLSIKLLKEKGFKISKTHSYSCPAFLFEPSNFENIKHKIELPNNGKPLVGFIVCGWNFKNGPFDKWPREKEEFIEFIETIEYLSEKLKFNVMLLSHSNGFPIPPKKFELQHGRDFIVMENIYKIVNERKIAKNVYLINEVLDAWETKAVISKFQFLISGRIHGAVAGLSQLVPTIIIDYGHEPKAHKLKGFALEAGVEKFVADPNIKGDIKGKIDTLINSMDKCKEELAINIPKAKEKAIQNFKILQRLFL